MHYIALTLACWALAAACTINEETTRINHGNVEERSDGPVYSGDILIHDADSAAALEDITGVVGNVSIIGSDFIDLPDLDLRVIAGTLLVEGNANLTSLAGLEELESVDGSIVIRNNDALLAAGESFGALTVIAQNLRIENNAVLSRVEGFTNLQTIGGGVYVEQNQALSEIVGMDQLSRVSGRLRIFDNPELQRMDGLTQVQSVSGPFNVRFNDRLEEVVMPELLRAQTLEVQQNEALKRVQLPKLQHVNGNFEIKLNPSLEELAFAAEYVGELEISALATLQSFSAPDLTTFGGRVYVVENPELTSFDLPSASAAAGFVSFSQNPKLPECDVEALRVQIQSAGGTSDGFQNEGNAACE